MEHAHCALCARWCSPRQLSKRLNELGSQLTRQQNAAQVQRAAVNRVLPSLCGVVLRWRNATASFLTDIAPPASSTSASSPSAPTLLFVLPLSTLSDGPCVVPCCEAGCFRLAACAQRGLRQVAKQTHFDARGLHSQYQHRRMSAQAATRSAARDHAPLPRNTHTVRFMLRL